MRADGFDCGRGLFLGYCDRVEMPGSQACGLLVAGAGILQLILHLLELGGGAQRRPFRLGADAGRNVIEGFSGGLAALANRAFSARRPRVWYA